jgi:hypothetical protein
MMHPPSSDIMATDNANVLTPVLVAIRVRPVVAAILDPEKMVVVVRADPVNQTITFVHEGRDSPNSEKEFIRILLPVTLLQIYV